MSNCSTVESTESCELVVNEGRSKRSSQCVICGSAGRPVERQTVLHHVRSDKLDRVNDQESYRFCPDPTCAIVYYGDAGARFTVDDLRELVTAKTDGDARPICYCFGFTEGDARTEIELSGHTTVPARISKLIKAGMCACEVRNPAGVCCLGEVNKTVKRLLQAHVE